MIARIHATRCLLHVTRSQFPSHFVRANSSRGTKISSVCSKYKGNFRLRLRLQVCVHYSTMEQSSVGNQIVRISCTIFLNPYFFFTVFIQPHNTFDVFLSLAFFFQEQPPVTSWRQTYVSKCNPSLSIFPPQPL